mgnify:FL=1
MFVSVAGTASQMGATAPSDDLRDITLDDQHGRYSEATIIK